MRTKWMLFIVFLSIFLLTSLEHSTYILVAFFIECAIAFRECFRLSLYTSSFKYFFLFKMNGKREITLFHVILAYILSVGKSENRVRSHKSIWIPMAYLKFLSLFSDICHQLHCSNVWQFNEKNYCYRVKIRRKSLAFHDLKKFQASLTIRTRTSNKRNISKDNIEDLRDKFADIPNPICPLERISVPSLRIWFL